MSGKGDKRRPMAISRDEFDDNWDLVFGKKESLICRKCKSVNKKARILCKHTEGCQDAKV